MQLVHSCLRAKLGIVLFFHILASPKSDTRSDTLAIPFWYINPHKSILSQETKKKGNQGPKDAKKQELKAQMAMNTDNYNSI